MKIAFYKAYTAKDSTCMDRLVAFVDRSDTSHCELVVDERVTANGATIWSVEGCHMARGGVNKTDLIVNPEDWRVYELPPWMVGTLEPYAVLAGQKYDWLGAFTTRWRAIPYRKNRKVCSTYLAKRLGIHDGWEYGVRELETWIKYMIAQPL